MAKLQKAQVGKIVKSVAKKVIAPVIKKRSWENVSGAAAYNLNKARKQFADEKKKPGVHAPSLDSLTKKQIGGKTSVSNSKEAFFNNLKKVERSKNVYTPAQMDSVNFARKIKNSPITKAKENITKTLKTGGAVKSKKK